MSAKARPAFSATLPSELTASGCKFFQAFSKLSPNFSKLFANFRGFSPSFSKFLFGGFVGFQRLKGQKILETWSFRVSPNFCPRRMRKRPPPPVAGVDGRAVLMCQTAELQSTTYFEKQKDICGFLLGGRPLVLALRPALLLVVGRRGSRRLFAAAMATAKRVRPERRSLWAESCRSCRVFLPALRRAQPSTNSRSEVRFGGNFGLRPFHIKSICWKKDIIIYKAGNSTHLKSYFWL